MSSRGFKAVAMQGPVLRAAGPPAPAHPRQQLLATRKFSSHEGVHCAGSLQAPAHAL